MCLALAAGTMPRCSPSQQPGLTLQLTTALCLLLMAAACGTDTSSLAQPPVVSLEQAVIGGTPAAACAWPSTVLVNDECTGTLIHSRIVTTAAHCLYDTDLRGTTTASIKFGPGGVDGIGSFSVDARCRAGAWGEEGVNTSDDWGYCVLPEDPRIAQVQVTPPLVGCEAQRFLKPGAKAWVVGFGASNVNPYDPRSGDKHQVQVSINALAKLGPQTIDVGDALAGACHGDSGGPLYMRLTDGVHDWGFRTVGSTSGPGSDIGCECTCSSTYVDIQVHVTEIERQERIDVTPCTDSTGAWDPGPACRAMPLDPEHGAGQWPNCSVAVTTEPITSCLAAAVGGNTAPVPLPSAGAGYVAPTPASAGTVATWPTPPLVSAGIGASGIGASGFAAAVGGIGAGQGAAGTGAEIAGSFAAVAEPVTVPITAAPAFAPYPDQAGQYAFTSSKPKRQRTDATGCSAVPGSPRSRAPLAAYGCVTLAIICLGRRRPFRARATASQQS